MRFNAKILLFVLIIGNIGFTESLLAQKEANWWYFGNKAGLNFNTMTAGLPQTLANGQLNTTEGCASISDKTTGNLLFYTDGQKVWDANHTQMTNGIGLLGHSSSTQSGVIVPDPGNKKKFYVFTCDHGSGGNGFRYSVVDMSLRSGLGDVVVSSKNTLLFSPACERITSTAIKGANGYWVIAQRLNSNQYSAYQVTATGVSTNAVNSTLGPIPSGTQYIGYMKASPKGDKVGVCYWSGTGAAFIMDFNARTGTLSNVKTDGSPVSSYGLEFSADGSKLYIAPFSSTTISQYDANATTQAAFRTSKTTISKSGVSGLRAMQIGPDFKIYIATNTTQLSVIQNPNDFGAACSLSAAGPTIPNGATVSLGLPTFIQSFFNPTTFSVQNACDSSWVKISVKDTGAVDSVYYTYGDTASSKDSSWNKLDSHIFSGPGKFEIIAYAYYTLKKKVVIDTLKDTIEVLQVPIVKLPNDSTICVGDSIPGLILNSKYIGIATRYWQDSSQKVWHQIDTVGKYFMSAINRCGIGSDTMFIDSLFKRDFTLGNDTIICVGDSLVFDISDTSATYLWSTGETNAVYVADTAATHLWGQSTNMCGTSRDTINIGLLAPPIMNAGLDKKVCKNKFAVVGEVTASPHSRYLWSTGGKSSAIFTYVPGTFTVIETNKCGVDYDTVIVEVDYRLPPFFRPDSVICLGDTVILDPLTRGAKLLWSGGFTDSTLEVTRAGTYWLKATNLCGIYSDTIKFIERETPNINLPNDTIICKGDSATLEVKSPLTKYLWSNGDTVSRIWAKTTGVYWARATNICGVSRDTISISVDESPQINLPNDTILCNRDQFEVSASGKFIRQYLWSTGNLTQKQLIQKGGTYRVTGINKCGRDSAKIFINHQYTPDPNLGPDTVICQGDRIELRTHVPPEILAYSDVKWNDKFESKELYVEREGWYKVTVGNKCGKGADEIEVKVRSLPKIKSTKDTVVCDNVILYDNTQTNYTFLWQDGSTDKRYQIKAAGDYRVEMWDELGCYNVARFSVRECPTKMWVPNAFSPNKDLINEVFLVYKDGIYDFEIEIYDRWNKVVYQSRDIKEGWNGGVDNDLTRPCSVGQYLWRISFKEEANRQPQVVIGEVNLVR